MITVTEHNHSVQIAEALKFLPAAECKENFENYFGDGMTAAEACNYHKKFLELEGITEKDFANSRINPRKQFCTGMTNGVIPTLDLEQVKG